MGIRIAGHAGRRLIRGTALAVALAIGVSGQAMAAPCTPDLVELRGDWGGARFRVELADTPDARSLGLMNRPEMARGKGMLFIYESPRRATFWMRNTLIPLDLIFLDKTGTVTRVHENAVPLDETVIDGGPDVLAVLEINGGMAREIGIAEGTTLRHPALDQAVAAFPCAS